MSKDTVFITGASGFLSSWIIKLLIEDGYRVIGSVRSEAKGDRVAKFYSPETFEYVIIKDLDDQKAFDAVFQEHPEIKYVLHAASPVAMVSQDPIKEVVEPAVNGVLSILKAAKAYGKNVKKLVLTSSIVAMAQIKDDPNFVYTEETWSDMTLDHVSPEVMGSAYTVSKGEAERKFWEFAKTETLPFAVSTIIVPLVLGSYPDGMISSPAELTSSPILLYDLYNSVDKIDEIKPESTLKFPGLDIRDTVKFHILAMTNSALDNKRVLTATKFTTGYDVIRGFKALKEGTDKECDFDKVSIPVPKVDNSATLALIPDFKYTTLEQSLRNAKAAFEKFESQA